jgi:hypothetical protein
MVKCRSWKCIEKHNAVINQIISAIPAEFRDNYEDVKKYAKPFITLKEWQEWKIRNEKQM